MEWPALVAGATLLEAVAFARFAVWLWRALAPEPLARWHLAAAASWPWPRSRSRQRSGGSRWRPGDADARPARHARRVRDRAPRRGRRVHARRVTPDPDTCTIFARSGCHRPRRDHPGWLNPVRRSRPFEWVFPGKRTDLQWLRAGPVDWHTLAYPLVDCPGRGAERRSRCLEMWIDPTLPFAFKGPGGDGPGTSPWTLDRMGARTSARAPGAAARSSRPSCGG